MPLEKRDVEKANSPESKPESGHGMTYDQRVVNYALESSDEDPHLIEFRLLQWLSIIRIQNDLARHERTVQEGMDISSDKMKELRTTLHEYGTSPRLCDLLAPS
jgi:hypothetical protein